MKDSMSVNKSRHDLHREIYCAKHRLVDVQYDPDRNSLIKIVASTEQNARDGIVYLDDQVKEALDLARKHFRVILVIEGEEYRYQCNGWITCASDRSRTRYYRITVDRLKSLRAREKV